MSLEVGSETLKAQPIPPVCSFSGSCYEAEVVSSRLPVPVAMLAACDHDGLLTL